MRNGDGPCADCSLHEGDIDNEETYGDLKYEWEIRPRVIKPVLCKTQIASSADDVISNLQENGGNEESSLCI